MIDNEEDLKKVEEIRELIVDEWEFLMSRVKFFNIEGHDIDIDKVHDIMDKPMKSIKSGKNKYLKIKKIIEKDWY